MAYAVRQPNGNRIYVYIAENIYRAELKQSRQVREYVGTLDVEDRLTLGKNVETPDVETVKLLKKAGIKYDPSRKRQRKRCRCGTVLVDGNCPLCSGAVAGVERIGAKHLLKEISSGLGLESCLRGAFGERWRTLFLLALHRSVTGKPLYLAGPYLESLGENGSFSSGQSSRFLREIGADKSSREEFLSLWREALGGSPEVLCDVTSISTYSARLSLAEWGYNRDHESLPQLNVMLASERGPDGMPVAYRLLPGSVPDVSTLENSSEYLSSLGYNKSAFRLDKGFHSRANVLKMHRSGRKFVIGVPFSLASARNLFSKSLNSLQSGRRSFLWNGRVMRHVKKTMLYRDKHGSENFNAQLYFEPERAADMKADFERNILSIESESIDAALESRFEAREWLAERARKKSNLFKITAHGMHFRLERKPNAVARAMKFMGCTLILTNEKDLNAEGALDAYRSRDSIEKLFDSMKNETGQNRLRTGDDIIAEGQMFLSMLSLILRKGIETGMRRSGLLKKYSVDALIAEIEKISAIKLINGGAILMEITKKQRDIFNKLEISQPQI